ncbi:MAG: nucleotide exchange factor GrpE [Planctomycetes bacterium]|nr:nucleotide exchange factor GrpE [Planctomycetota bacterium]
MTHNTPKNNESEQTRLLKKEAEGKGNMENESKVKNLDSAKPAKKSTRKKQTRKEAQEKTRAKAIEGPEEPPKATKGKEEQDMMVPATALKEVEAQRDEYLQLSQRMRADLENYRKRVLRRQEDDRLDTQASVLDGLLAPLDDLKRALAAARENHDFDALFTGLEMVQQGFWKALAASGLEVIVAAPGVMFDPKVHEAVTQLPHPEVAAGLIVEEIATGYKLGERILRAAKVVVSAGQPAAKENQKHKTENASEKEE